MKKILFLISIFMFSVVLIVNARTWKSKKGSKIEGEFQKKQGRYVYIKSDKGKVYKIPIVALSEEDQEYVNTLAEKKEEEPVEEKVEAPSKAEFMKVVNKKCTRCHKKPCASVESLVKYRWLKPGNPKKSPTYTIIGKHRKKGDTYHNVSEDEKKIIHDYIKAYDPEKAEKGKADLPTEEEFNKVMAKKCVRCHKPCKTVDAQVKKRWIKPGNPDKSPSYTIIGKHRKKNGKYHNVSKDEKKIIYDFIKNME